MIDDVWLENFADVAAVSGFAENAAHKILSSAGMIAPGTNGTPSSLAILRGLGRRRGLGLVSQWHLTATADFLRAQQAAAGKGSA